MCHAETAVRPTSWGGGDLRVVGLKATADRRLAVSGTRFGPTPSSLPEGTKLRILDFAPKSCPSVALLEYLDVESPARPEERALLRSAVGLGMPRRSAGRNCRLLTVYC